MKISVLTPAFNSYKWIGRAIESVLCQDFADWEHIVVDGGSSDGTLDILKSYAHLRWVSEPDRGQADAMNKAIQMATGQLVVFLNADDEFNPGAFREVWRIYNLSPDAMRIIVGGLEIVTAQGRQAIFPELTVRSLVMGDAFWPYNPVSYFADIRLYRKIGLFPVGNHFAMDYWWLLRALRYGEIEYSNVLLGVYHNHGENKSADTNRSADAVRQTLLRFVFSPSGVKYLPTTLSVAWRSRHRWTFPGRSVFTFVSLLVKRIVRRV